ncbi:hypothetical protein GCM10010502_67790 [Kitasatospora aureofaciens]|uniref:Uncharacterized protein n=1 Tax=Kitasatospora aureofaciens TaxID=1894 RepID=A0A8H9HZV5_KITAU|nr:hypothetical protein GCM10010502_67790 [Kitasatospora aureofaciens]
MPLGHLDLKPEHLHRRSDGEVVLLDVESVRPDVTGLIDLTLPAVLRQAGHDTSPDRVLGLYLDAASARRRLDGPLVEVRPVRVRGGNRVEKPSRPGPVNAEGPAPR